MKKLLFVITTLTATVTMNAQMPYNVTTINQSYQPLTNGTSINNGTVWHDTMFSIPLGFSFKIGKHTITHLNILGSNFVATDTAGTVSGFLLTDAELIDRGAISGQSKSPIRYSIAGSNGSRIFKAEWSNAGFAMEKQILNTLDDSLNMQIWLYEGTNVIELHYGASKVSNPLQYFEMLKDPVIGYVKDVNYLSTALDKIYLLSGNPTSPAIDSFSPGNPNATGLITFPSIGTVYRFTPKNSTTGIGGELELENLKIFPSVANAAVNVNYTDRKAIDYSVLDIRGSQTAISGKLQSGNNTIDISRLLPGMYMLRLSDNKEQKIVRIKFVKE